MPTFYVPLEKSYIKLRPPDNYDHITINGYLPLEAPDQRSAQAEIKRLLGPARGELQTCDPRIVWEEEPPGRGWELEDFSFGLREGAEEWDWLKKPN